MERKPIDHWHHVAGAILLASVLFLAIGSLASADPTPPALFTLGQAFVLPDPLPFVDSRFAESVAFVGDDVLIGSTNAPVRLFDDATGALLQTIVSPYASPFGGGGEFGAALAPLGSNAVIGAPFQNSPLSGGRGEAYLFNPENGTLLQAFVNPANPPPGGLLSGEFGRSVAALGDGVLIGAPHVDEGGEDAGAAYIFDGNATLLRTLLDPNPAPEGEFGFAVASLNGNPLVGAPFSSNDTSGSGGTVYLFDRSTGVLLRTFSNPAPNEGDRFGWSLATSGSQVLISAPRDDTAGHDAGTAYLFDGATGALLQTFTNPRPDFEFINDDFGLSVAFAGGHVLVGAPWEGGDDVGGAVYLFDTRTGALRETLRDPSSRLYLFGWALATHGNRILIGAPATGPAHGAAYLYTIGGIILTEQGGVTEVTEGGAVDSYELVLLIQPTAEVIITLSSSDNVTVTPESLNFTPTDWDKAKTVTVTAVDDAVEEGDHNATIEHAASSADPAYNGLTVGSVTVLISDNDVLPEPARIGPEPLIVLLAVVVGIWVSAALISLRSRRI